MQDRDLISRSRVCIPAEGGCRGRASASPELYAAEAVDGNGSFWAGVAWEGRRCTSAGPLWAAGEDADGVWAALPGGKVIATPRHVAQGGIFAAITCASAVISVLQVPFLRACKDSYPNS